MLACIHIDYLLISKLKIIFKEECINIWSIALYGAENWTIRNVYQKYPEMDGDQLDRSCGKLSSVA